MKLRNVRQAVAIVVSLLKKRVGTFKKYQPVKFTNG